MEEVKNAVLTTPTIRQADRRVETVEFAELVERKRKYKLCVLCEPKVATRQLCG